MHVQFPVRLAFASTIMKIQGRTLEKAAAAVDVGQNHLYVSVSRVRMLKDFKLLKQFTVADIKKCGPSDSVLFVMQRLRKVEKNTLKRIQTLSNFENTLTCT